MKDSQIKEKYDYLVVGAGLFGAVFAHEKAAAGKKVLVIDKRPHVGGNVYTEEKEGINVHVYGAHIFHTNDDRVWEYVNRFARFNDFINSPIANFKGELYNLPFNMNTFEEMWGVKTAAEAEAKIEEQKAEFLEEIRGRYAAESGDKTSAAAANEENPVSPDVSDEKESSGGWAPRNLEEQAISLVGRDIFEKLVKGYTEKQWGRDCKDLPAFIIKRLPVRFTYDNNYFNAKYQGIPIGGYTKMVERMLGLGEELNPSAGAPQIDVALNTDYLEHKAELDELASNIVYTGPIDAYFGHRLGALEYRSLCFKTELLDIPNFQGNAAVNYTDRETPWTRIIEHKWFEFGKDKNGRDIPKTIITREFSSEWKPGDAPYYPVNDDKNTALYQKYRALAEEENAGLGARGKSIIFGGRLAEYKYYDMDQVILAALNASN